MSLFLSLAVLNRESGSTRVCLPWHLRAVLPGAWQRGEFGEIYHLNFLAFWGKAQNRCSGCLRIFQGTYKEARKCLPGQRAHFPADKILLRYKILAEKNTKQKILASWIFPVCNTNLLVQVTEDDWHFRSPSSLLVSTC